MIELKQKYTSIGGWEEEPKPLQSALNKDINADVVIIGGGLAGLCASLELVKSGLKVVVLEKEFSGFGASGRNAGYLGGALGLKYDLFLKKTGTEGAKNVVDFYEKGVDFAENIFKEYTIDCDYIQSGLIRAAIHESQEKSIRNDMKLGAELGCETEFLDHNEMRARGIPPAFLFGSYISRGGTLNPGKYIQGLRRAAIQAGVELYENTPMVSFHEVDGTVKVKSPNGSVSAANLILANNAYMPQLGLLQDRTVPLRVSAIETMPLSPTQLNALGWYNREGITTAHHIMESHRLTARNTLVCTTKKLHYVYGSKTPNEPDFGQYRALKIAIQDRFPMLKDISIKSCWSGYISYANDALPVVGTMGRHKNIYYAAGCAGHGLGTQGMIGNFIAKKILGYEESMLTFLMANKTPRTLPEPLRWCVLNGALFAASRLDEQVNRKART
ncbi:FAD-binding oxidoreductase [Acinetobacter suaedae]|uniref:FAD-binding oxidoreductase n=2 Tax=Acinetobacter suaedae TaxID=2609668 RepID=A0A5P1UYB5_9GAMM|nr:FAD-binding oxidoreductase [Acinetobacter sp. C16S1]